jgi:hypothetical protein
VKKQQREQRIQPTGGKAVPGAETLSDIDHYCYPVGWNGWLGVHGSYKTPKTTMIPKAASADSSRPKINQVIYLPVTGCISFYGNTPIKSGYEKLFVSNQLIARLVSIHRRLSNG